MRSGKGRLLFTVGEVLAVFLADSVPLAAATRFDRIVSGAEVNVAAGFVRAGHRARLVTAVGQDALADAVLCQLAHWGVDARASRPADRATGVLVRTVGGSGRGEAVHLRRGAAIESVCEDDVEIGWSRDVDAVFVSGVTAVRSPSVNAAVRRSVELARRDGALVVVDPNVRPALAPRESFADALAPLRGSIDVALGDAAELALLAGTRESDAVRALLDGGARLVVRKQGSEGAVAFTPEARVAVTASKTDVVDTVGAGDAFAAGLLDAMFDDMPLHQTVERASLAAAAVVRVRGDVPQYPSARVRDQEETRP